MTKAKLTKPTKYQADPYYDYKEIRDYINNKYKVNIDSYGEDKESFLFWLIDHYQLHNDSYFTLDDDFGENPKYVKEILKMIFDEFGEGDDELYCYFGW